MDLRDWLIFLHVLGAFLVVTSLVALWTIVLATRGPNPALANDDAMRIGKVAGPMVGVGMMLALIFGIWLSFQVDGYHLWDGWILGALVLWALGGAAGGKSGQLFSKNDSSLRTRAIQLQAVNSATVFLILILMIWKPGA